jgi:thymidylate synthase
MRVIESKNVNDAWPRGLQLLQMEGEKSKSRNGDVTVHPMPVATVYEKPCERVLFDPVRDANPFFHLHEALWMLAGRDDATWLDVFVKDFSSRFAEEGGRMHGAYGKRWRSWFGETKKYDSGIGEYEEYETKDQLNEVVRILSNDPTDRQCVIQMWDAVMDLGVPGLKDRPCNTQIYLRADRQVPSDRYSDARLTQDHPDSHFSHALDMTVTCRSNDIVYGCYGANVVHFSVLQEYLAARMGYRVGRYTQVSNNFHMYDWALQRANVVSANSGLLMPYPGHRALVNDPASFDEEVRFYCDLVQEGKPELYTPGFKNTFFTDTAAPMYMANVARVMGGVDQAILIAGTIAAPDWRRACVEWLERRRK